MLSFTSVASLFLATVSAITITNPAIGDTSIPVQYNNGSIIITWSSVSTDPTQINLQLSTNDGQSSRIVAENIQTSLNSYAVNLLYTTPGSNYAVNISPATSTGQTGILAQSGKFQIEEGIVASFSTTSSAASTSSSATTLTDDSSSTAAITLVPASVSAPGSAVSDSSVVTVSGSAVSGSAVILPGVLASGSAVSFSTANSSRQGVASGLPSAVSASHATKTSGASAASSASGAAASGTTSTGSSTTSQTQSKADVLRTGLVPVALISITLAFLLH